MIRKVMSRRKIQELPHSYGFWTITQSAKMCVHLTVCISHKVIEQCILKCVFYHSSTYILNSNIFRKYKVQDTFVFLYK